MFDTGRNKELFLVYPGAFSPCETEMKRRGNSDVEILLDIYIVRVSAVTTDRSDGTSMYGAVCAPRAWDCMNGHVTAALLRVK